MSFRMPLLRQVGSSSLSVSQTWKGVVSGHRLLSNELIDRVFFEKWQVHWTSSSGAGFSFRPLRSVTSFCHLRDVTTRTVTHIGTFSRSVLIIPNPLIYGTFRTFRLNFVGCITRRQDIEKASCRNVSYSTRLLVLLCCFRCVRRSTIL